MFSRVMGVVLILMMVTVPLTADSKAPAEISAAGKRGTKRGLKWLLRAQNPAGYWGLEINSPPDIGTTCLAAMALMANGSTPSRGKYAKQVSKALNWVLAECQRFNYRIPKISTSHITAKLGNQIHGFLVTLFLAEMIGMQDSRSKRDRIQKALQTMVGVISRQQKPDGSWNNQSFAPLLATASAWTALRAAYMSGMPTGAASVIKTVTYIESKLDKKTGIFGGAWRGGGSRYRFFGQAAALRVLYGMGRGEGAIGQKGIEALFKFKYKPYDRSFISEGENYMAAFYSTQALFQDRTPGRAIWKKWFSEIQRKLISVQNRDGSWRGTACITSRVFCTACSLLTLQIPYRHLPSNEY